MRFTVAAWLWLAWAAVLVAESSGPAAMPQFRYYGVVLSAEQLKYRPHDDIIYPSVLRPDAHTSKPLGKYYLYYAPHDVPGGICLAYADKVEGPWTEYGANPIIKNAWPPYYKVSHVSGPDAIWNSEEKKMFLYFHGENDVTRLAVSSDGLHFSYGGAIVNASMFDKVSEASYGRVFQYSLPGKGNSYIMLLMGNNRGTRRIYLGWSKEGRAWQWHRAPLLSPPPGTDQVAGAIYLRRDGHHYLIFHANNSKLEFNQGFDLYLAETDAEFKHVTHLGKFMDHRFVSPENPAVMSPCFLEDEGRLNLFFNIGPRLKNKIALAIEVPRPEAGKPQSAGQR